MPVDIRNFFTKKAPTTSLPTTTKINDSKASSSSSNKNPDTKSTSNKKSSVSDKSKCETTTANVKNKSYSKTNDTLDDKDAVARKPNETNKSTSTTTASAKTTTTASKARTSRDAKRNSTETKVASSSSNNKKRLVIVDSDDDDDDYVVPIDDSDDDVLDNHQGKKQVIKATTPIKRKDTPNDKSKYFRNNETKKPSNESTKIGAPSPQKKLRASPRSEIIQEDKDSSNVARRISPRKAPPKPHQPSLDSDNDDIEIITKTPPKPVTSSRTTAMSSSAKLISNKVTRSNSSSTAKQRKQSKQQQPQRDPPLQPAIEADYFDANTAVVPQLLDQYTFVLSGVLESLSREDAQEMIKVLGGRVTTAVSSKTDYLLVGTELEDGRPYTEGSKYKKATDLGTTIIVHGERAFFGLLKQYNDKAAASNLGHDDVIPVVKSVASSPMVASSSQTKTNASPIITKVQSSNERAPISSSNNAATASVAVAAKPPPFNPYSKGMTSGAMVNPYASKNPYAKKAPLSSSTTNNSFAKKPAAKTDDRKMTATSSSTGGNQLWVDKYKPTHSNEVLGNQDAVRKLSTWLATWEERFNNPQSFGKSFSAPSGPWKAALLSGPPGIGKTTTATLVAHESGRDVLEFNASDVRSKKAMQEELGDITGSRTIEFTMKAGGKNKTPQRTKRCIIMDEVDGMGGGDRSGVSELIQMIKHSRVPIICICNDRQNQKLKSLIPYCMDLKYRRPVKSVIANRAVEIAEREGLYVERNAAEAIVESCGNDVRQVLNCLQMWASSGTKSSNSMTYKDLKEREHSINKDEILRVGLFDATRLIVEGRKGLSGADLQTERNNFFQRNDAFFVDYSFIGLMVQQNYLKVMQGQFNEVKRLNDDDGTLSFLDRMSDAANTMSEFAVVENSMRDGQGWSLLPFSAALAVKTGYHAGGERGGMLPGFPEFTTWLGRNSTKGKKVRMLKELGHHMNFNISAGTQELRLSYLPVFRERFLSILTNNKNPNVDGAIELMDEYGLDRDDLFEKIEEFKMDPKGRDLSSMDSKMKAAFTRAYNQGIHKSQALVAEQGATGKKGKRQGANPVMESADLDAIDDDNLAEVDEENEEEEELDDEKIKELFKKKGRGGNGGRSASKSSKPRGSKKK